MFVKIRCIPKLVIFDLRLTFNKSSPLDKEYFDIFTFILQLHIKNQTATEIVLIAKRLARPQPKYDKREAQEQLRTWKKHMVGNRWDAMRHQHPDEMPSPPPLYRTMWLNGTKGTKWGGGGQIGFGQPPFSWGWCFLIHSQNSNVEMKMRRGGEEQSKVIRRLVGYINVRMKCHYKNYQ